MSAAICLFAKPPVAGEVKTRLIPHLGAEGAAELARAFLLDTWRALQGGPWEPYLATTGPLPAALDIPPARVWPQGGGDLGVRMERALRRALGEHPKAMVVGADVPLAGVPRWTEALALLDEHDAVLGQAEDGGFDLMGLRRCPPALLEHLPWSCAHTLASTRARLLERGLSVALLEPLFDVDEPADVHRLVREVRAGTVDGEATRAWVKKRGLCQAHVGGG